MIIEASHDTSDNLFIVFFSLLLVGEVSRETNSKNGKGKD
jgi:hypothetical protein